MKTLTPEIRDVLDKVRNEIERLLEQDNKRNVTNQTWGMFGVALHPDRAKWSHLSFARLRVLLKTALSRLPVESR